jgi:hypothetical protein
MWYGTTRNRRMDYSEWVQKKQNPVIQKAERKKMLLSLNNKSAAKHVLQKERG